MGAGRETGGKGGGVQTDGRTGRKGETDRQTDIQTENEENL